MSKIEDYCQQLKIIEDWDNFLLESSGLPGPRANLELAQAVAQAGDEARFLRYLTLGPEIAPTNSPPVFLAFCGVLGLGRLVAEGKREMLVTLRQLANDPRWRIREGVAIALQSLGRVDMYALLTEMKAWSQGNWWEKRAAAAAIAEPDLLKGQQETIEAFEILESITKSIAQAEERTSQSYRGLRQSLGYCWSVLTAALPTEGKQRMENWLISAEPEISWIMRENLKKKRLERMDLTWVLRWREYLEKKPT